MHIVLSVLAVLGWVLLALLALLLVLLVLPVFVDLRYKDEAFTATLRVLFWLKIPLYPFPEGSEPPEPEPPVQEAAASKPKKAKRPLLQLTLEKVWAIVSTAGTAMRRVLRGLWITNICVVWPVHEADAAETALAYGKAQAYFGGAVAALRNFLNLRRFMQVDILADYDNKFASSTYLACTIGATPVIMGIAGVYALVRLFRERVL